MMTISPAERRTLETHRLSKRWSFRELGQEMDLPETTIQRILQTPKARMHDTTAFVVREYLRTIQKEGEVAAP